MAESLVFYITPKLTAPKNAEVIDNYKSSCVVLHKTFNANISDGASNPSIA